MKPYADTNFFTRLYLPLPDSPDADELADVARRGDSPPLPILWLHRVEFVNALQLHVFAGRQPGHIRITPEQAAMAWAWFRQDLTDSTFLGLARVSDAVLERQFEELALRHTARHGFRTYDLLHVASALTLGCDGFWTFDHRTRELAGLEGLKTAASD